MLEYRDNIKIYKRDNNDYYTNTGCNIIIYREDKLKKLKITCDNRKPSYDEIKYIRYELLNKFDKSFFFYIEDYSSEVTLIEYNPAPLPLGDTPLVYSGRIPKDGFENYVALITIDAGVQFHMSVSSNSNEYIPLEHMYILRDEMLPSDIKFGMILPPEKDFINVHKNCFHLYQI